MAIKTVLQTLNLLKSHFLSLSLLLLFLLSFGIFAHHTLLEFIFNRSFSTLVAELERLRLGVHRHNRFFLLRVRLLHGGVIGLLVFDGWHVLLPPVSLLDIANHHDCKSNYHQETNKHAEEEHPVGRSQDFFSDSTHTEQ